MRCSRCSIATVRRRTRCSSSSRTSRGTDERDDPLGDIAIAVTRKAVKNVHLSVHPPAGSVTLVAPTGTRPEVARAYAISKLGWIRDQQAETGESSAGNAVANSSSEKAIPLGRRYLLSVVEKDAKPSVHLGPSRITLTSARQQQAKREEVIQQWHRALLHAQAVPALIKKWEAKARRESLRLLSPAHENEMGGCNHRSQGTFASIPSW